MSRYKEQLIIEFLSSRGWEFIREGSLFNYFSPPELLNLPVDFEIEIPKYSKGKSGFDYYINNLIKELSSILFFDTKSDDLSILFSKDDSILKYRIFDAETLDGTIPFQKHLESLEGFKKVLSQAVTFEITKQPIFGAAKFEVDSYLNRCRALQTEKGSYVTKLSIPNGEIYSTVSVLDANGINTKLFDVFEFIEDEIFNTKTQIEINENYIQDISEFLNYELFHSIKDLYSKPQINNIELQLSSVKQFRKVQTTKVQSRIPYFNRYLREIKNLLLELVSLEATGFIKRLSSTSPLHSSNNEVLIVAEIANTQETIKVILDSEEYIEAIEAHKHEWAVRIKGKARQGKTQLSIKELELFEILRK
ncbi:hypothetical protein [Marinigracilibium pacificum]|uniref:Uncharacterized protein n=1 Tax=Marinigracilibium pacificum TaxID=2729599 RepID=A0A848J056_9BACT|nr:hypothetical protein [Marinigracilibium pacificum]NMM47930.1 hypothetical protein [Marinigracilibium pacificum]